MLVCGLITRQTYSVVQDSWLRFQLFFRERDLFSTEGYGKYQAQTREGVWVVSLFFIFLFLQGHGRGQNKQRSGKGLRQICRASVRDVISA